MADVWVVIPYNGEGKERLDLARDSAADAGAKHTVTGGGSLPENINDAAGYAIDWGATHICWLSTGDTLHPDRFKHELPTDKGQCCLVDVHSRGAIIPDPGTDWQRGIYTDNQFCGSGMVVPVHIWDAVGGFDESLTYCSDWDFALKVQHMFGWECVPEVLAYANEYEDGLSKSAERDTEKRRVRARDRAIVAKRARDLRQETRQV